MSTRFLTQVIVVVFCIISFSCKTAIVRYPTNSKPSSGIGMPPGHAKKVYGHQSARAFAPGQQKKRGNTVVIIHNDDSNGHGHGNGKGKGKKKK